MKNTAVRSILALAVSTTLTACGGGEATPADTNAAASAEAAPPPATLASIAGDFDWTMKPEVGDSVLGKGTSHTEPDGTGWALNAATQDTVRFTSTITGDSVIQVSQPYTDATLPKEVGQVIFRYAGLAITAPAAGATSTGLISLSPAAKPDTVIMRARVDVIKR